MRDRPRLDEVLPSWHFREFHSRMVAAPSGLVYRAVKEATLAEMPLVRVLFDLRSLPARLAGRAGLPRTKEQPLLAQMIERGFTLLAEDPGRELVAGTIAQMWKRGGQAVAIHDAAEFVAFDRPGFVKAAMNFRLVEQADGTRLDTETRVLATDAASRKGFARYWLGIRLGSGAIRRSLLRAIARRAERAPRRTSSPSA